jgi:uncharacterized membrane protein
VESKAKLAGHPIHPMLIVFPLGLLATAVLFDIIDKAGGSSGGAIAAYWNIAAGIIGGLLAAVVGLWDWVAIPSGTRAKRIGLWHGAGNVVIVGFFAISWLLRRSMAGHQPTTLGFVLEIIAVLLALGTGWLGGELVERLGVGVDEGAHLDAPSSLSGQPAGVSSAATRRLERP